MSAAGKCNSAAFVFFGRLQFQKRLEKETDSDSFTNESLDLEEMKTSKLADHELFQERAVERLADRFCL